MPAKGAKKLLAVRPRQRIQKKNEKRRRELSENSPAPLNRSENADRKQCRRECEIVAQIDGDQKSVKTV